MDKAIEHYIASQAAARQDILRQLHAIIIAADSTVVAVVEPMMGKEMIVYKCRGLMKYALAGVKKYMSLHLMPIYGSTTLYEKYQGLLNKASFQKGCINFDHADQMPLDTVQQLLADCAKADLLKIKEAYLKAKKAKAKN